MRRRAQQELTPIREIFQDEMNQSEIGQTIGFASEEARLHKARPEL